MYNKSSKGIIVSQAENVAKITGAILSIVAIWKTLHPLSPHWTEWLLWSIVSYLIISSTSKSGIVLHRASIGISIGLAISLGIFQIIQHQDLTKKELFMSKFEKKLATLRWIAYEPISYDPNKRVYGTEQDISQELDILLKKGFNGLITFSSDGLCGHIPHIAKNLGFEGIIMGITNVRDSVEVNAAILASSYVDAYCVGQMFTERDYYEDEVLNCMRIVAKKTKLPVSTTLRPNGYEAYPRIAEVVDWFFPDIHVDWYFRADAEMAFAQTKQLIEKISQFRINKYPKKPLLLKMICFPSAGVDNATEEEQARFYRLLITYIQSSMDFPEKIYPSYFSAFDIAWKTEENGWAPGERFLGLFRRDRTPKKAADALERTNTGPQVHG